MDDLLKRNNKLLNNRHTNEIYDITMSAAKQ